MAERTRLTVAESGVYAMIALGRPNKAIARQLGIADSTVKAHITSIMKKLSVTNRVQIALTFHDVRFQEE